jgi:hypothetical protein
MTTEGFGTAPWMESGELCCINFKDSVAVAEDPANMRIQGMVVEESVSYSMIQRQELAMAVADRDLMFKCYPLAKISFPANRDAFRLQCGDLFKLSYSSYGIVELVCRVASITEEDLNTEVIRVEAIEDPYYISNAVQYGAGGLDYPSPGNTDLPPGFGQPVISLADVTVVEAPFVVGTDPGTINITTLAGREMGYEVGYIIYLSTDGGASYNQIDTVTSFNATGDTVAAYSADTLQIDDDIGFEVDFNESANVDQIQSITREQLLLFTNAAVLGDELITFQNIEPVIGYDDRYYLSGIYRGRLDTEQVDHDAGEDFYFLGSKGMTGITVHSLTPGSTAYFKLVPYSGRSAGDLAEAVPIPVTITGRSWAPLRPTNLSANDNGINATYTGDIVLDWHPRPRGSGAGYGNPDIVTDASPTWEGKFHIKVYVDDVEVREIDELDVITWTYTSSMNTTDNGTLADEVVFKMTNYLTYEEYPGNRYYSPETTLTVKKE